MGLQDLVVKARLEKNMSQGDVAKLAGVTASFISQLELGTSKGSPFFFGKLCVILGLDEKVVLRELMDEFAVHLRGQIEIGKKKAIEETANQPRKIRS